MYTILHYNWYSNVLGISKYVAKAEVLDNMFGTV